ncbi:MAG: tetratricopeptide repeat protein, partial [Candidatus Eisenbacteria bacterium]|nr:tetratricopeptide repeat protein [Candidatus Eisenbacteria bacterium]
MAALLSGCAYFNTFHHAKQAYSKARRLEEESRSEKLPPEAIRYYDKAIEKSAKVIFEHGGGWWAGIDDALFLMGASYYGKREYGQAIKKFRELILNYPDSEHVPESLFYTGLSYSRLRNQPAADRTFARVLREYPDFERRDEILFTAAETRESAGERERALADYRRLLREFPDSPKREEVLERVGEMQFEDGRYDSALIAFRELAEMTRDDELYFEAQLQVGACLVRLDRHDEALDVYQRILPEQPERDEKGGRVWLAMAEAENRKGNHEAALEHLARVIEHFEKRGVGVEAAFRTGYTYETYLEDYAQARESYEQVNAAAGRSVFKDQAARRLRNLRHLEELQGERDAAEADLERRADAALQVAEFRLFEGRDPDSALEQYALVIESFPTTSAAVRAAYARGMVLQEADSLSAARGAFRDLIAEHPASAQAERAVELLGELEAPAGALDSLRARVRRAQA